MLHQISCCAASPTPAMSPKHHRPFGTASCLAIKSILTARSFEGPGDLNQSFRMGQQNTVLDTGPEPGILRHQVLLARIFGRATSLCLRTRGTEDFSDFA